MGQPDNPRVFLRYLTRKDMAQMQFVDPSWTEEMLRDQFANPRACGVGVSVGRQDGGPLVGWLIFHCFDTHALLVYVVVQPKYRLRRLGNWLVRSVYKTMREKKVRSIIARLHEGDEPGWKLLRGCEYEAIALLTGRFPPDDGILLIRRVFDPF